MMRFFRRGILWQLCVLVAAGSVLLFLIIDKLSKHTETRMSHIKKEHQQQIIQYAQQAEAYYQNGQIEQLERFLNEVQQKEQTWAAVVSYELTAHANGQLDKTYLSDFSLGRDVSWKIHLYFKQNPVMDVAFADKNVRFLIRLPQRMRPGTYWRLVYVFLQIALPLLILSILATVIYRYLMQPLNKLRTASLEVSRGNYHIQLAQSLTAKEQEFSPVAKTFDHMAHRVGKQITEQRDFIADFSHELRTPIARIETALSCIDKNIQPQEMHQRIKQDTTAIRKLAEDALTLAWLDNEEPRLDGEQFDLIDLVECIVDDAQFEYQSKIINFNGPDSLPLYGNSKALGQALENIIRNALKHARKGTVINIVQQLDYAEIWVIDDGKGVPEKHLTDIFKPFFRVAVVGSTRSNDGFGLGLALAKREIQAFGGDVTASNQTPSGLKMSISVPLNGARNN